MSQENENATLKSANEIAVISNAKSSTEISQTIQA
jgi:hypothetical protein